MSYMVEKISRENMEKYNIAVLEKKFLSPNFDCWTIDSKKQNFLMHINTSSRVDDSDFGVSYFLMNLGGQWVEFEVLTLDAGGVYKENTWVKYSLKHLKIINLDKHGQKQHVMGSKDGLDEIQIINEFKEALTAWSLNRNRTSLSHKVIFENFA
jgi:hypothetical protein